MSQSVQSETGSLFKAIDGSHLKWNDFRRDVLLPFGIYISEAGSFDQLPPTVIENLEQQLASPDPCDERRALWRSQVALTQGFEASSMLFPPNILPPVLTPTRVQRCLTPKMSREGLPRRTRTSPEHLFELPHAKPLFASAFVHEAFSEAEHKALPSPMSPTGTFIDFVHGSVIAGRAMPCPFLVFERCPSDSDEDVETTLNMCALAGAQCLRGIFEILRKSSTDEKRSRNACSFSCALNDNLAIVNCHSLNDKGQYQMTALCKFDLAADDHFTQFQTWVTAIEEWAATSLLPDLRDSLTKLSQTTDVPPVSPMPSLTLSIDTMRGSVPSLLRALRTSYPAIKWQSEEMAESPIVSSIAHCGTPWEGRKLQSLALGLASPTGPVSALRLRRRQSGSALAPVNTKGQLAYAPARPSPFSPRWVATPDIWESQSPCRPGTLSPCTPAPDMPWAARSPMLVLQKRVEIAMNEIQELRSQMESLTSELETKTKLLREHQTPGSVRQVSSVHVEAIVSTTESVMPQGTRTAIMLPNNKPLSATNWGGFILLQFLLCFLSCLLLVTGLGSGRDLSSWALQVWPSFLQGDAWIPRLSLLGASFWDMSDWAARSWQIL